MRALGQGNGGLLQPAGPQRPRLMLSLDTPGSDAKGAPSSELRGLAPCSHLATGGAGPAGSGGGAQVLWAAIAEAAGFMALP